MQTGHAGTGICCPACPQDEEEQAGHHMVRWVEQLDVKCWLSGMGFHSSPAAWLVQPSFLPLPTQEQ